MTDVSDDHVGALHATGYARELARSSAGSSIDVAERAPPLALRLETMEDAIGSEASEASIAVIPSRTRKPPNRPDG